MTRLQSGSATQVSHWVRTYFPELVLASCALGFGGLLTELIGYEHYQKGSQIIGFVSVIVGLLTTLLAFVRAGAARTVSLIVFAALLFVGVFGVLEHRETRQEDAAKFAQRQSQSQSQTAAQGTAQEGGAETISSEEGGAGRTFQSNIPLLAPLAVSGLSVLALMALLARRREA